MSWLFSQVLVEEYSEGICLDGEPSVQLNVMPTQHKFWHKDKTIDASQLSQFGLTCAVLMADRGEELLTWFRAGFPARTLVQPELVRDCPENDPVYGKRWHASFAKYDQDSCSWKTPQFSLLGGLDEFSETWPRWGFMHAGECWELPISDYLTVENASGLWPTPVKTDGYAVGWCETSIRRKEQGETRPSGAKIGSGLKYDRRTYPYLSNGYPNPALTEWLMEWPGNWTDLQPLAMDKFHEWLQQHSPSCQESDPI